MIYIHIYIYIYIYITYYIYISGNYSHSSYNLFASLYFSVSWRLFPFINYAKANVD